MHILIWTQPNCVHCTRVKQQLDRAGLEYEERDIGPKGSAEREEFKMFHATTPQVYVDGQWLDDTAFGGNSLLTVMHFIEVNHVING